MNLNLTNREFRILKNFLELEIKSYENQIEKFTNTEHSRYAEILKNKVDWIKPISEKLSNEYENINIIISE